MTNDFKERIALAKHYACDHSFRLIKDLHADLEAEKETVAAQRKAIALVVEDNSAKDVEIAALWGLLREVLNSDMAMRETDEYEESELLNKINGKVKYEKAIYTRNRNGR